MKIHSHYRRYLRPLAALAKQSSMTLYAVGGCVRDGLRGTRVRDIDLVVEKDARILARACVRRWGGSFEEFGRFKTVRLFLKGEFRIDIARARKETYPQPAALPVVSPATLGEDLKRRDFSINAMARPLSESGLGGLIDPFYGAGDLRAGRVRILHKKSFVDDPTRIFRAARYGGRLGFALEADTRGLLAACVGRKIPWSLSRERVRQEVVRILEEKDPSAAMRFLRSWKMLPLLHPRFKWPAAAVKPTDAMVRLGVCALAMPESDGLEFLESLPLARAQKAALSLALKVRAGGMSPREALPPLALSALRIRDPKRSLSAYKPLFVGGADLRRLGLPAGKIYAQWLDRAARRQWRGDFRNRSAALTWLKKTVS